ncbi:MAG: type I DNA topoisomerase [Chloroflexi bacterium]|nr:type I DNA topoisomerase [Chloroflexota bacterium]
MKNLVIVESPAKTRTLAKLLSKDYILKASQGHIRDLPKSKLGIEVEKDFIPKYVVPKEKRKIVQELREAVASASAVYLATDPDREGEAISWHIAEVTRSSGIPYRRVVFHEITKEAIEKAFKHPRTIDMQLVNAQQARRILDRLVGYKISPFLWQKVRRGLSAGRVQSVAVKIIVDREREIEKFVPEEYWSIEAELAKRKNETAPFRAALVGYLDGKKLAIHNKVEAEGLTGKLQEADYSVFKVTTKKASRQPPPPFITSTMQQEAWRKLHFSVKQTMAIAQQLYEGLPVGDEGTVGLITYMRTDSTNVARSAVVETREFITEKYGAEFVPAHARTFVRSAKWAQEAHEAIRPTSTRREPSTVKPYLTAPQFRLYQLIWQRMVASQMAVAEYDNTSVDIKAKTGARSGYLFRAAVSILRFLGFTILYSESKDEPEKEGREKALPSLEKGDALKLLGLFPEQHFTQPPPRFTEASLVKTLEQYGIGRPSTYAPIISTIKEREYVTTTGGVFKPTELGFLVNDLLARHFPDVIDIDFTARLENELDDIAHENKNWVHVVQDFYVPLAKNLETASAVAERVKFAEEPTGEVCPNCGKPLVTKTGRFGKFVACSGYPECKYTRSIQNKIGVKCPECGAELLERRSKKGRTFYGCSAYPKCNFATNLRPLPQLCPKCGGLMAQFGKAAKCLKCGHRGKVEELPASEGDREKAITKGGKVV